MATGLSIVFFSFFTIQVHNIIIVVMIPTTRKAKMRPAASEIIAQKSPMNLRTTITPMIAATIQAMPMIADQNIPAIAVPML